MSRDAQGAAAGPAESLDWSGLMRVGMGPRGQGGLGLNPGDFWTLSPAELALMLGVSAGTGAMTRDRLAALSARFPDRQGVGAGPAGAPVPRPPDRREDVSD